MKRREFIALLGTAAAWPLAARAQQPSTPVIGFLRNTAAEGSEHLVKAFREGLSEAGFIEGQNVAIDYRYVGDQQDSLAGEAADLVGHQVAAIVGNAAVARVAMAATTTIPIVFVAGLDPVQRGLVSSLNKPGGNVTGVVFDTVELTAKRLGLLSELLPKVTDVGVLLDSSFFDFNRELRDVEEAGRFAGRQMLVLKATTEHQIEAAFKTMVQAKVGAILVGAGPNFLVKRRQIVALATRYDLPASYVTRQYPEAGGLMSYGPNQTDAYRRAGLYVGKILKGEKPADMPVELPTRLEMVINLKAAKLLGIEVPAQLLARADEAIE